jgi:hypothetical protein
MIKLFSADCFPATPATLSSTTSSSTSNSRTGRSAAKDKKASASASAAISSDTTTAVTIASASTDKPLREGAGNVSYARKFHQSLIVGLIEACKGISELYQDALTTSRPNESQVVEAVNGFIRLQEVMSTIMAEYTKCIVESIKIFYEQFALNLAEYHELEKKSLSLQRRLSASAQSPAATHQSQHEFQTSSYSHYDDRTGSRSGGGSGSGGAILEISEEGTEQSREATRIELDRAMEREAEREQAVKEEQVTAQGLRAAQLRLYEYDEDRQSWMLLARQTILDCQYLDKEAHDCLPTAVLLSGMKTHPAPSKKPESFAASMTAAVAAISPTIDRGKVSSAISLSHADSFASVLLAVVDSNNELAFQRRIMSFIFTVVEKIPEFIALCDLKAADGGEHYRGSGTGGGGGASSHGGYGDREHGGIQRAASQNNVTASGAAGSVHNSMHGSIHGSTHGSSSHGGGGGGGSRGGSSRPMSTNMGGSSSHNDPNSTRNTMQKRSTTVRGKFEQLVDSFIACFAEICADYKPVVEVHVAAQRADAAEIAGHLVWRYIDFVCCALEQASGVTVLQKDDKWSAHTMRGEFDDEIYCESAVYTGGDGGHSAITSSTVPVATATATASMSGASVTSTGTPRKQQQQAATPVKEGAGTTAALTVASKFALAASEQLFLTEQNDFAGRQPGSENCL